MLTHHVDHVVHRLDAVERRTSTPWRTSRMGRLTVEAELARLVGERRRGTGTVLRPRVPMQHDVHVVHETGPDHIDLPRAPFLCRGPIDADRSWRPRLVQPLLHRERGRNRAGPEQVMAARVTRDLAWDRVALRGTTLVDARQGVVLTHDPDDRTTATV